MQGSEERDSLKELPAYARGSGAAGNTSSWVAAIDLNRHAVLITDN